MACRGHGAGPVGGHLLAPGSDPDIAGRVDIGGDAHDVEVLLSADGGAVGHGAVHVLLHGGHAPKQVAGQPGHRELRQHTGLVPGAGHGGVGQQPGGVAGRIEETSEEVAHPEILPSR